MQPIIVVFVAQGCGACHAYEPIFRKVAAANRRSGARVHVVEISSKRGTALANKFGVRATPTTLARTAHGTTLRRIGALDEAGVQRLFDQATR